MLAVPAAIPVTMPVLLTVALLVLLLLQVPPAASTPSEMVLPALTNAGPLMGGGGGGRHFVLSSPGFSQDTKLSVVASAMRKDAFFIGTTNGDISKDTQLLKWLSY